MAATRTFTANFVGRTSNLEKSFKRVSKGSATMSDKLMRATRMAGIGFGALAGVAVGAAAALKPMIDKAASMEESLSKNRLMFGESSKAVEQFAETSLHAFGVTERAALEATGVFGSLGKAMNMSEADSASMSTTLTGLAGDLSSLHDVSVETALTALRAGLIGEAEPLRKFGILLDAASIKTKALTMGLVKNTKEALTPAIKSQAAYALILEKGEVAMGDFARTSDSATGQQKILAGEIDRITTQIGESLLPTWTSLLTFINDEFIPGIEAVAETIKDRGVWEGGWEALGSLAGRGMKEGAGVELSDWAQDNAWWDEMSVTWLFGKGVQAATAFTDGADWSSRIQRDLDDAITDLRISALGEVIQNELGRLSPDWDRGDWETAGTAAGAAFYGAAAAMAPGPGFPPFLPDPFVPGSKIPGPGFPADKPDPFVPGSKIPGPGFPADKPDPFVPGPKIPGPGFTAVNPNTLLNAEQALRMLSDPTSDFSAFLPQTFLPQTGPPGTPVVNITVNAPAVSGQELVEELGKYIDMNGPLGPQFISQ